MLGQQGLIFPGNLFMTVTLSMINWSWLVGSTGKGAFVYKDDTSTRITKRILSVKSCHI